MSPTESAGIATLRPALAAYGPLRDRARSLTKAGNLSAAIAANKQADHQYDTITSSLGTLTSFNKREAATAAKDITSTYRSSRDADARAAVVALMIGLAIAFLVSRSIKRARADHRAYVCHRDTASRSI